MPDPTLDDTPLLAGLTDAQRRAFVDACTKASYPAGEQFFTATSDDAIYLLLSGTVQVCIDGTDQDIRLATLGPGQTLGEMSFLDGECGRASVLSEEAVTLLTIDRQQMETFLNAHPVVAARIWKNLCLQFKQRLSQTNQLVEYSADMNQILTDHPDFVGMFGGT